MICKNMKLPQDFNGSVVVSIELTNKLDVQALQALAEVELLDIEVKKHRKKRSLTQNAYLWTICDKIAKVLNSTKIEVYRLAIRNVGVFTDKNIDNEDVEFFVKTWRTKGDGWVCDKMIDKPNTNQTTLRFHKGSSKYDTEEMSRLIDYIVTEAKELGIDTMTIDEVERLRR